MFKDDDEEEENTFGVTRYPCMPSLVALQQMRNRLHLAFLGRKLMKWTALATGRELRRLAQELYEVYDGFGEDLRNAFILLARSRYFYPTLNSVVTEDIGKKAGVVVQQCGRTVSGVKIVQFEIFETEYPPYPHLGIEKGGQTIMETKKAWLELLRRLIMMMQLRAGFLMVELANRNANKKMNVLKRIVIPRTNLSVGYILTELEEMAREEFHRLKKVKEKKKKDYELRHQKDKPEKKTSVCKICEVEQSKPEEIQITKQLSEPIEPITIIATTPALPPKIDLIPSEIKSEKIPSSCKICASVESNPEEIQTTKELSENVEPITVIAITPESAAKPDLIPSKTKSEKIPSSCRICASVQSKPEEIQRTKQLSENIEPLTIIAITPVSAAKPDLIPSKTESEKIPSSCRICVSMQSKPEEIQRTKQLSENIEPLTIIAITPESAAKPDQIPSKTKSEKVPSPCRICGSVQSKPEQIQTTKELSENIEPITIITITPESAAPPDISEKEVPTKVLIQKEPEPPEPFVELYTTPSAKSSATDEIRNAKVGEDRLEYLKRHLNELIALGKEFLQTGVNSIDINEFLKMCEEAKLKLEQFFTVDDYPKVVDTKLERKLEHLKCHLREVIDITKEFKPEATLTSSVENFIKMCEDVDEKLEIYKQGFATPSITTDNKKVRLEEFKGIITDVENITREYNKRGLLSPSAEVFLQSCCAMKSKVDKYMCCKKNKVTISIQPSLEKEISEEQPTEEQTPVIHSEIDNLIKHIDQTIDLGIEAREEGLISDSVEDTIKSFDEIKSRITCRNENPEVLQNLRLNIEEIMSLIQKLKAGGIVTASVEDLLKLCEETRNKLYLSQERSPSTLKNYSKATSFSCIDSCMNNTEANLSNADTNILTEETPLLIDIAPCESCNAVEGKKDISKESLCITCSQMPEEVEDTLRSQTPTILNSNQSQETVSISSEKNVPQSNVTEDNQAALENNIEPSPSTVDSTLGYFEKKLQKKVTVTRTQNIDGTIWEQKETITIRKEKHDPAETSLNDDDNESSDEISDEEINEQVNICLVPNITQQGFIRNFRQTRSDSVCKRTPYVEPCLKYCLSVDNLCLTMEEQISCETNNFNEIELLDTDLNHMNCSRYHYYKSQN